MRSLTDDVKLSHRLIVMFEFEMGSSYFLNMFELSLIYSLLQKFGAISWQPLLSNNQFVWKSSREIKRVVSLRTLNEKIIVVDNFLGIGSSNTYIEIKSRGLKL